MEVSDIHDVLGKYAPTVAGPNQKVDHNNQVPQPYAISLPEKASNLTADFGYVKGGDDEADSTIGNLLWLDINGDGIYQFGEPAIGNVTAELWYDMDSDGEIGVGDVLADAKTTTYSLSLGGNYIFENDFPNGDYLVRLIDTNNVLATFSHILGPTETVDGHSKPLPYLIQDFNPPTGPGFDVNRTADFGYEPPESDYSIVKELSQGVSEPVVRAAALELYHHYHQ